MAKTNTTQPSNVNVPAAAADSEPKAKPSAKPSKPSAKPSKPSAAARTVDMLETLENVPVGLIDSEANREEDGEGNEAFKALVASVVARGILTPILLARDGERFRVVAGRRRLRAAIQCKMATIPAKVYSPDGKQDIDALIENVFRKNLTGYEEAHELFKLSESGLTGADIENFTGIAQSLVNSKVRIFKKCIPEVIEAFKAGKVGVKDAITLASAPEEAQRKFLAGEMSAAQVKASSPENAKKKAEKEKEKEETSRRVSARKERIASELGKRLDTEGKAFKAAKAILDSYTDEAQVSAFDNFLAALFDDGEGDASEPTEGEAAQA